MTGEGTNGRHGPDPDDIDAVDAEIEGILDADPSGVGTTDPSVGGSLHRVRSLADEPLPDDVRARHLLRIRTHEPSATKRSIPVGGTVRPGRRVRRVRRRIVALATGAMTLLVLTGGTTVAAAQGAQPDDLLYGVKRASEQAWLNVPRGSDGAAGVHLALAERRIDEVRGAPQHAERLIAEGLENVEAAAEDRPEDAIANFGRLLGEGPDKLPDEASPMARAALHRNCMQLAERHDIDSRPCGAQPDVGDHPGGGRGLGDGEHPGRGPGAGDGADVGPPGDGQPRGWGPGGRPDGAVGPPPGTPGHGNAGQRGQGGNRDDDAKDRGPIEELDGSPAPEGGSADADGSSSDSDEAEASSTT